MRTARVLGDPSRETNFYHAMSRLLEGRFLLEGDLEKAKLREILLRQAAMSGVRILTYAIMSNHFHVLLAVDHPENSRAKIDDDELLERLAVVTEEEALIGIRDMLKRMKEQSPELGYPEYRARLLGRMYDLSFFMKEVKQRFTQWYNKRHGRKGPLWEDRFKSVLVEEQEELVKTMAAYIDLNAVRAGLVEDPKDYRWCGYGEAVGGSRLMRAGLKEACGKATQSHWRTCQADYRLWLFGTGEERAVIDAVTETGEKARRGIRTKLVEKVERSKGALPWSALLRCRIRYLTDSQVIGSKQFLDEVFARNRKVLKVTRDESARCPRGLKLGKDWRVLRDLRGEVVL